jgi:RNA 3'-terminal phosphate cyclase-like protein
MLRFEGSSSFRCRVVASILCSKPLRIDRIREKDDHPGLHEAEASFLRLIEKLSDGSTIQINETGTSIKFKPGIIVGGNVSHDCGNMKSIGWFIEGILPLLAFAKEMSSLQLTGITNDASDLSVDTLKHVTIPLLRNFGVYGVDIRVKRRGAAPNGGGLVELDCPIIREMATINLCDMGLIKRVRGISFCSRISPTIVSRVVDSARSVLNNFLPDVQIRTDHYRGADGGRSAGYSVFLVAESTTGVKISAERTSLPGELPENVGREGAYLLLEELRKGIILKVILYLQNLYLLLINLVYWIHRWYS